VSCRTAEDLILGLWLFMVKENMFACQIAGSTPCCLLGAGCGWLPVQVPQRECGEADLVHFELVGNLS
jgi:hypothetical protein